jgi:hypothetical protein
MPPPAMIAGLFVMGRPLYLQDLATVLSELERLGSATSPAAEVRAIGPTADITDR